MGRPQIEKLGGLFRINREAAIDREHGNGFTEIRRCLLVYNCNCKSPIPKVEADYDAIYDAADCLLEHARRSII